MFDTKEAGMRIRIIRIELGLEMDTFEKLVGISDPFLGLLEIRNCFVSNNNLLKMSQVLGVSTDYILKGNGERKQLSTSKKRIADITQNILSDAETEFFVDICISLKACGL